MTYAIGKFTTKTTQEIHDDYLRTIRNGLIQAGVSDPQLGPGSDEDLYATAIANELAPVYANTVIKADAQMPDTASGDVSEGQSVGEDLARLMGIRGMAPRPASPSTGGVVLDSSATTIIPSGAQLVDAAGLRFNVQTPGSFAVGALVSLIAEDVGSKTNHVAGDTLTWVATPPYCNSKQLVAAGGLTGGTDAEDTETARARLLDGTRNPPGSGNWAQACEYAEASTPIVQKAFCYPAAGGPSTLHVAVVGYATDVSKTRDVDATVMSSVVVPYVLGKMPQFTEVVTTTVTNKEVDASVGLTLPASPQASPAGPGGGWKDGSPWPAISGVQNYANITSLITSSQFVINAPTAPTAGVSRICTIDTVTWKLLRAKVIVVTGTSGAYTVTIDNPFPNLVEEIISVRTGSLIFPDAENMEIYVAAFLQAMALMGPGEKVTDASVFTRGYRHPLPQASWPHSLNSTQLKAVEDTGAEVTDTDYYYRSTTTPAIGAITVPPTILVPRAVGFYPI